MALHKACIHNYSDNIHIGRGVYYLVYPSKFITALNYAYIGVILREPPGTLIVTICMSQGIYVALVYSSCFTPKFPSISHILHGRRNAGGPQGPGPPSFGAGPLVFGLFAKHSADPLFTSNCEPFGY